MEIVHLVIALALVAVTWVLAVELLGWSSSKRNRRHGGR